VARHARVAQRNRARPAVTDQVVAPVELHAFARGERNRQRHRPPFPAVPVRLQTARRHASRRANVLPKTTRSGLGRVSDAAVRRLCRKTIPRRRDPRSRPRDSDRAYAIPIAPTRFRSRRRDSDRAAAYPPERESRLRASPRVDTDRRQTSRKATPAREEGKETKNRGMLASLARSVPCAAPCAGSRADWSLLPMACPPCHAHRAACRGATPERCTPITRPSTSFSNRAARNQLPWYEER